MLLVFELTTSYLVKKKQEFVLCCHILNQWPPNRALFFFIYSSIELEPQLLLSRWHRHLLHLLNNNHKVS